MGGEGSGCRGYHWWRGPPRTTVEDCTALDLARLLRKGGWRPWHRCAIRCRRRGRRAGKVVCLVVPVEGGSVLILSYRLKRTGETRSYPVRLGTTGLYRGGLRRWLRCPLLANGVPCDRRVRRLYLPPGGRDFGCRRCHNLTYTSSQESHKWDKVLGELTDVTGGKVRAARAFLARPGKRGGRRPSEGRRPPGPADGAGAVRPRTPQAHAQGRANGAGGLLS
jgi:hypothetical protein